MTDEDLRLKAAEISINSTIKLIAAAMQAKVSIEDIDYFALSDDIMKYVKTGIKPEMKK